MIDTTNLDQVLDYCYALDAGAGDCLLRKTYTGPCLYIQKRLTLRGETEPPRVMFRTTWGEWLFTIQAVCPVDAAQEQAIAQELCQMIRAHFPEAVIPPVRVSDDGYLMGLV